MPLYLLKREKICWDEHVGHVIRAPNPRTARLIASTNCGDEPAQAWLDRGRSSVTLIPEAGADGIILTSTING